MSPREPANVPEKGTDQPRAPEAKCPACGSALDRGAYLCLKCQTCFCWKCRKRVPQVTNQFQCANRDCECHGKLLCAACTVILPVFGDVKDPYKHIESKSEPTAIGAVFKWVVVVLPLVLFCFTLLYWHWHWSYCALAAVLAFAGLAWFGSKAVRFHTEPMYKQVDSVTRKQTGEQRCCIQCRQPVEVML